MAAFPVFCHTYTIFLQNWEYCSRFMCIIVVTKRLSLPYLITATSNDRHVISNYRSIECWFYSLFRLTTKKHCLTVPLWGNSIEDRWFPHKGTVTRRNNSIWWRHNASGLFCRQWGNQTIASLPVKQSWRIWANQTKSHGIFEVKLTFDMLTVRRQQHSFIDKPVCIGIYYGHT